MSSIAPNDGDGRKAKSGRVVIKLCHPPLHYPEDLALTAFHRSRGPPTSVPANSSIKSLDPGRPPGLLPNTRAPAPATRGSMKLIKQRCTHCKDTDGLFHIDDETCCRYCGRTQPRTRRPPPPP